MKPVAPARLRQLIDDSPLHIQRRNRLDHERPYVLHAHMLNSGATGMSEKSPLATSLQQQVGQILRFKHITPWAEKDRPLAEAHLHSIRCGRRFEHAEFWPVSKC